MQPVGFPSIAWIPPYAEQVPAHTTAQAFRVISEIVTPNDIEKALDYIDVIQIGARNMQNFELLKAAGSVNKPVLLKRGIAATIDEFIHAAEYIMSQGNGQIILCERGIRTYEKATRNTLDISAVPILNKKLIYQSWLMLHIQLEEEIFYFHVLKQLLLLVQMV